MQDARTVVSAAKYASGIERRRTKGRVIEQGEIKRGMALYESRAFW
jgi:hypothetical protein